MRKQSWDLGKPDILTFTSYSRATCASAWVNPSGVISFAVALPLPDPLLHLAKITPAVDSLHLAPSKPHARTTVSHCSGAIPPPAPVPAKVSKDKRSAFLWSRGNCMSSRGLYDPLLPEPPLP